MVMYYFDEKSTLVSAVLKIGIRDLVETTPRSILHRGMSILQILYNYRVNVYITSIVIFTIYFVCVTMTPYLVPRAKIGSPSPDRHFFTVCENGEQ